ncbi:GPW/gp25 family protein [Cupriavidus nantongensis]|uniref:IraD/Gp25-like domain-containing protein n=1 Tax=Cupriavidus nantongensis TaxID=1796606 RepID=A0A142JGU1_9BURK|nr:GPW/gp25 family protein [Cupriavidus nantongensis]AMR77303.1 hypothetical protein A2G96_05905 [Cupriavidus nantongensis]
MSGMHASTGRALSGVAHIEQSVADIITTPIGTRVERRDYGSNVPFLIDQPNNGATAVRVYAATVAALWRWEPRVRVARLNLTRDMDGSAALTLDGSVIDRAGRQVPLRLDVPLTAAP